MIHRCDTQQLIDEDKRSSLAIPNFILNHESRVRRARLSLKEEKKRSTLPYLLY